MHHRAFTTKGRLMPSRSFFTATACALVALSVGAGCKPKEPAVQEPAADLSESTDIFRQPIPPTRTASLTGAVASVNGVEISAEAFQKELGNMLARIGGRMPPEQLAQMQPRIREQVLDQMIARQLLIQEANRLNLTVTDADIADARAKLEAALPPGISLEQVLEQRGVSPEQFQREFGDEVRITMLIEQVTSNELEVSEADASAFYEENRERMKQPELATARHILVAVEKEDEKEAKKAEAEALRARLNAGEDFAEVAKQETDDPGSRETGGLYTFPRGQMVPPFEEAAFTQEIGAVGPLVETQFGFHIIKVEKREEARDLPFDEVKTNLIAMIKQRKAPDVIQGYLMTLRTNADVKVLLNN